MAQQRGVTTLALADHDTTAGLHAARAASGDALTILAGVEISTLYEGQEIHLLGYLFDPDNADLQAEMASSREARITRAAAMVEKLGELGVPVDLDRVLAIGGPGSVGRPHIAQALIEAGHVPDKDTAFDLYLGNGKPAYVARYRLPIVQAIELLHAAGGVAVLAHPVYVEGFRDLLPLLVAGGLDGLEVYYPKHEGRFVAQLRELARVNGLITTGGTDFHHIADSPAIGSEPVPPECVEQLHERAVRYT